MWSELFFQNAKDYFKQIFNFYSNKEIEYELYSELRSYEYKDFVKAFSDA